MSADYSIGQLDAIIQHAAMLGHWDDVAHFSAEKLRLMKQAEQEQRR